MTATNANQKTDKTTPFHSNVVANHSPEKCMPKKSAGSKKGEIDVTQKNDSEDDSLDLDAEGMREAIETIQQDDQPKKPLVISVSPPSYKLRKKEFGEESKWFKTASGNTIDVIYFVLSFPIGKEDTFESMLKSQIHFF